MHVGEVNPKLLLLNNKIWFHVGGFIQLQEGIFPILIQETPLPEKVGVWCDMCATRIMRALFRNRKLLLVYFICSDAIFKKKSPFTRGYFNSTYTSFKWYNEKQAIVNSPFTRSESVRILFVRHISKRIKLYSNNPRTKSLERQSFRM